MTHEAVEPIVLTSDRWLGSWDSTYTGLWIDQGLHLVSQMCLIHRHRFYEMTNLMSNSVLW